MEVSTISISLPTAVLVSLASFILAFLILKRRESIRRLVGKVYRKSARILRNDSVRFDALNRHFVKRLLRRQPDLADKFEIEWGAKGELKFHQKTLHVVIPFFNNAEVTKSLLRDIYDELILKTHGWQEVKCVILDDESLPNESVLMEEACRLFGFEYVRRASNLGFLKNVNKAVEDSICDYALLLNSDVRIPPQFFQRLHEYTTSSDVGLLTVPSFEDLASYGAQSPTWWELDDQLGALGPVTLEACTAVGYALLVNLKAIEKPLFDVAFGHGYGEDSDLHFRVQRLGMRSRLALNMVVFHAGGLSYGQGLQSEAHRKQGRDLFWRRWGRKYSLEHTIFQRQLSRFLSHHGVVSPRGGECFVLSPSPSPGGIGGLAVFDVAAKDLSLARVRVRFLAEANLSLAGTSINGAVQVYSARRLGELLEEKHLTERNPLLVFGGQDTINSAKPWLSATHKTHVRTVFLAQGPDLVMDSARSVEFTAAIRSATHTLVVSKFMEQVALALGAQSISGFRPFSTGFIPSPCIEFARRKWDLIVSIRPEHGKAAWLSEAMANHFASQGLRVASFASATQNLDPRITQFGSLQQDRLFELLSDTRVFFDSSLYEGYGLVPREALLAGAQVVAVRNGGNNSLEHFRAIQLFEAWDFAGMVRGVGEALTSPSEDELTASSISGPFAQTLGEEILRILSHESQGSQ